MTSKYFFSWLPLALLLSAPALAQTAPGWGWVRTFNDLTQPSPTSRSENLTAGVGRDAAGNLYVAGSFIGNLTIGPPPTTPPSQDMDVFVAKFDPAGTLLWVRTMHSIGPDVAMDIVVSPGGRCTVAGNYGLSLSGLSFASFGSSLVLPPSPSPTTACGTLPFVAAINPDGSLAWASSPAPAAVCGLSFTSLTYKNCLATDAQDNVYWTVTTPPAGATAMSGTREAALLKFNASGQVQWTRRAAPTGQPGQSVLPASLRADQAGNLYWSVRNSDPFTLDNVTYGANSSNSLIKLATATNQVQWVKDDLFQVEFTPGNYVPGGYTIAGIDAAAGKLYFWIPTWGRNIAYNGPGSPIMVPPNNLVSRFYLAQTDLNGQVQWVKLLANLTTTNTNVSYADASVYPSGNGLAVLTETPNQSTLNFVGDATTYTAAQAGLVVVARFNPTTGLTEWVRTAGTDYNVYYSSGSQAGTTAINAVADPTGNVYVAGLYYGPAHFGGTALGFTNSFSSYLAKLDQSVLPTRPAMLGKTWQPYPNPATGSVQLSGLPTGAQVSLLDALGRTVRRTTAPTLGLGGLAPGLYLLQVGGTAESYQSQRLTVE
ncbi:MAG: T9SS type A sorting domain-containing protein [Janthinobacterium lividum]